MPSLWGERTIPLRYPMQTDSQRTPEPGMSVPRQGLHVCKTRMNHGRCPDHIPTMTPFASQLPDSALASAPDEAYRHLSHAIRMGHIKPGDRLVADEVANLMGMSRMPVREAFRQLASEGLLVMRPNRGAVVRELSEEEVIEVFEMRAVLEGLAASMASKRISKRDIADLEDLMARMTRCGRDLSEWITVHRQFHERLCEVSGAPRLLQQISALHSVVEPLMRIWLENDPSSADVQAIHEQLLQDLQSGDADRAEVEVRMHVRQTADGIVAAMRRGRQQRGDTPPHDGRA